MKSFGLELNNRWLVTENEYELSAEANHAALLTTGNGYMGVRASLEEFGSLGIQGCYIRGVADTIVDIRLPYCDNMYMKKYYFDEDKLKDFETQECVINFIDFLLVRFTVDGEVFYPWEGNLISWKRTLDMESGCLRREVVWENSKGDRTRFFFERFASFDNDHVYCIRAEATPLNHSKQMTVTSGLDLRTKTNGQHVQIPVDSRVDGQNLFHENLSGKTYGFRYYTGVRNDFYGSTTPVVSEICDRKTVATVFTFDTVAGETYTLEKKIHVITSRDPEADPQAVNKAAVEKFASMRYQELLDMSRRRYSDLFAKMDVAIEGDDNADCSVRFSNYHTLISIARNDAVHSLSAKALTGEIYNNFVWWDAEVYQTPVFIQTMPETVRNVIKYRYRLLDQARENAREEGRKGARFPFTSLVTGKETVWIYARHPFMQIHINSDIALNIINYLRCTGDEEFFLSYGMEILLELARYWTTRVSYSEANARYEILTVTGTDEHHPYVNNNAYTNYSVYIVLKEAVRLYNKYRSSCAELAQKIGFSDDELAAFTEIADKLYLPFDRDTGMIPQFDDYFTLSRSLEVKGGSTAKSFQMKQSGLYNESQVIKQPDVMLLFSYMNLDFGKVAYCRNWDYYEARCEASSSLSYPVHAICAADLGQPERTYQYLLKTARLDLDDEHGNAAEGIHAACAAGAWLSVARGIAGMKMFEDRVTFEPHFIPWWRSVSFHAVWHGQAFSVKVDNSQIMITADKTNTAGLKLECMGHAETLQPGFSGTYQFDAAPKGDFYVI